MDDSDEYVKHHSITFTHESLANSGIFSSLYHPDGSDHTFTARYAFDTSRGCTQTPACSQYLHFILILLAIYPQSWGPIMVSTKVIMQY